MPPSGLQDLFATELSALLSAHKDSVEQSGENISKTANPKLKRLFKAGADINGKQAKRLEKVFAAAGLEPSQQTNTIIAGIDEANSRLQGELTGTQERELARISMAQATIHYYISKYGALRAYAQALGHDKAARLLGQSLRENKEGDKQFSKIAEGIMVDAYRAEFPSSAGIGPVRLFFRLLAVAGLVTAAVRAAQQQQQDAAL